MNKRLPEVADLPNMMIQQEAEPVELQKVSVKIPRRAAHISEDQKQHLPSGRTEFSHFHLQSLFPFPPPPKILQLSKKQVKEPLKQRKRSKAAPSQVYQTAIVSSEATGEEVSLKVERRS